MIAFPRTGIPIPDAVADLARQQLPKAARLEIGKATRAGRMLTDRPLTKVPLQLRMEASAHHHAVLCAASKQLARYGPQHVYGWGQVLGLKRKEER
ncbi:hypothetical protein ACN2WE_05145 [Streptomyces sp. cg28]|uniref:hypothetical protein n=1 Tax=Streptomyces sp. cg28 TaxID=3403457 RepID=UPI003B222778